MKNDQSEENEDEKFLPADEDNDMEEVGETPDNDCCDGHLIKTTQKGNYGLNEILRALCTFC